jgi:hypothetical protein
VRDLLDAVRVAAEVLADDPAHALAVALARELIRKYPAALGS